MIIMISWSGCKEGTDGVVGGGNCPQDFFFQKKISLFLFIIEKMRKYYMLKKKLQFCLIRSFFFLIFIPLNQSLDPSLMKHTF
jgi:hypothetical protein